MMAKRKIDIKKSLIRICILAFILGGLIYLILNFFSHNISRSINSNARTYKSKSCTVFYPNNKEFKKYAKDICSKSTGKTTVTLPSRTKLPFSSTTVTLIV